MGIGKIALWVAGLCVVGTMVMGALGDSVKETYTEQLQRAEQLNEADALESSASASPLASKKPSIVKRVGSSFIEQAILDAFPPSPPKTKRGKKEAANAADVVGAAINRAGYLCARPVEMQQAASDMYGIGCITYNGGGARSEPPRDCRRPFGLSYAAMGVSSSMA